MNRYVRCFGAMALCAIVTACGGGGGGAAVDIPEPALIWQTAQFLETSPHLVDNDAQVAIGADGNGVASWVQFESVSGARQVFASRYRNGLWEPPVRVSDDGDGRPYRVQVAMMPDGEALIVWAQGASGEAQGVFSKRSVNGAWSGPRTIVQAELHTVGVITLEANASGHAVAVWGQVKDQGDDTVIQSAEFRQGELTSTHSLSSGESAKEVGIAVDAKGDALAAWVQRDPQSNTDTVRVRALVGAVWQPEKQLKPAEAPPGAPRHSRNPKVALGSDGSAYVASANLTNTRIEIRRAIDFAASQWLDEVMLVGTSPSAHLGPELVLDQQGNATLVWLEDEGAIANLVSARIVKGPNGLTVQDLGRMETDPGYAEAPVVAIDGRGRIRAVWTQESPAGNYDVLSSQFDPSQGAWSAPEMIERDDVGSVASSPSLAVNSAGRGLAVWVQGIFGETSNHFDVMGNALR